MDPAYIVNLQGRDYVLYGGVLDLAHQRGLESIQCDLIQIPTADNEHTAIVKAIVRMKDGTTFEEYGDSSPRNVNARIATALIRMAATRAKGRALRDATNIGQTMLEELPDLEENAPSRSQVVAVQRAKDAEVKRASGTFSPGPVRPTEGHEETWTNPKGRVLARKDLLAAMVGIVAEAKKRGVPCSVTEPANMPNSDLYEVGVVLTTALQEARKKTQKESVA